VVQQVESVAPGDEDQLRAPQQPCHLFRGGTGQRQHRDRETHDRQAVQLLLNVCLVSQHIGRRGHIDDSRVARVAVEQPGQAVEAFGPEDQRLHARDHT
jgi:hypothetical protein